MTELQEIASHFRFEGEAKEVKPLGEGFINDTYIVKNSGAAGTPDYILQRKNHKVFPNIPAMMENIEKITSHIRIKAQMAGEDASRATLQVVRTVDGALYYRDAEENYWAATIFIPSTVSYDRADTPALAQFGGEGLGKFQALLADFREPLADTLPGFHNIRFRFEQWDAALKRNSAGRTASLEEEIGWIESRRAEMLAFWQKVEDGTIPLRVTHNDTKISNFLFDKESGALLCAIDLDTVMKSTVLNDFGDAIRSYANTGAEDDTDISNVSMSMEMFRAYARGYISRMGGILSAAEFEYVPFSARYITFEQVLRFLMDYIDGDTYYKIRYPEHNLVRTRAQYALLQSMEKQYDDMIYFIKNLQSRK